MGGFMWLEFLASVVVALVFTSLVFGWPVVVWRDDRSVRGAKTNGGRAKGAKRRASGDAGVGMSGHTQGQLDRWIETARVYGLTEAMIPVGPVIELRDRLRELEKWERWVLSIHPELDTQPPTDFEAGP